MKITSYSQSIPREDRHQNNILWPTDILLQTLHKTESKRSCDYRILQGWTLFGLLDFPYWKKKKSNNKKLSMWSQGKLLKRECTLFMLFLPSQFLNTPWRRAPRASIHHRDPGSMALSKNIYSCSNP